MFHGRRALSALVRLAIPFTLAALAIVLWPPQPLPATGQVAAAYAFSEGTGASTADFSGNSNTGALAGGPAWSTAGRYGGAIVFDGVDDRVAIADSASLDLTSAFTLAAWIHPTAAMPSGTILHKGGTSGPAYALGLTADAKPFVTLTTSAGTYTLAGDESIFANQWTHVAATYEAGVVRLFVNGIKEWSGSTSGSLTATGEPLTVGGSATDGYFEGRIDEVRVDAQALSVAGVREDMNTPVDPATPLTVGTHTPASGARGVLGTPITARFTRSVDATTVTTNTIQLRRDGDLVSASVSYDAATRTVTVAPASPLAFLANYSVTVLDGATGVKDTSGEELAATVVWSFQTGSDANTVRLAFGFVEGAGVTVEDASGNGNTGVLTDGPPWTTQGKYGRGLVFDGVNDTVRIADADTQDVTTALTLEAWVYPTNTGSLTKVLHKQGYSPDHPYFLGLTGGAPYARVRTGAGAYSAVGPSALALNTWTHVAATYDGTAIRVFVNGVEASSSAATGAMEPSHKPLWLGSGFNAEYFEGRVDDVRLYAKALTAAEIVDDMQTSVEDITGPTVTSTNPIPDALDIATTANVTATFNEALAASSVSSSTFELRDALGTLVPATVSYDGPTRTATLDPTGALAAGTVYTATLSGGLTGPRITDTAGNPLATGYSWSFTTSSAPGAPTLVSVSIFPRGMSLSIGGSHQFAAAAHYSDGATQDVTATASWQTIGSSVSVDATGRATALAAGDAVVRVVYQTQQSDAPVTVYEGEALPPDPRDVAPPTNLTAATLPFELSSFLYSGENPIQRGVLAGTIEFKRASVVRGTVTTRAGAPLAGVRVAIAGRPEFGHTLSRLDGGYDLVVNGGERLTLRFEKDGYLPADRPADIGWHNFYPQKPVALVPVDPVVTAVLPSSTVTQVARGSVVTDADGTRQAVLLFPPGNTVTMVMPDGTTQPMSALSVRATELTVGPGGRAAMPAPLPGTSGYTYAVDFSIDEARTAGAREVRFTTPVVTYTTNFISFPAGTAVPAAYYDPTRRVWMPVADGIVIAIVGESGGFADVDVEGTGIASSQAALDAVGITTAERQTLAAEYAPGDSLWRVPVTHFSAYDFNWPIRIPPDATGGGRKGPSNKQGPNDCDEECQSIIATQSQTLGEVIPVVGTPYTLNYRSNRVPGRRSAFTLEGELSGPAVPASLKRIELSIKVAGAEHVTTYEPIPNQRYSFTWDGKDSYGRPLQGSVPAVVTVGNVYDAAYGRPRQGNSPSFAQPSIGTIQADLTRAEFTIANTFTTELGVWDLGTSGGNGWSLNVHHTYNPSTATLYTGDGRRRSAFGLSDLTLDFIAGGAEPADGQRQRVCLAPRCSSATPRTSCPPPTAACTSPRMAAFDGSGRTVRLSLSGLRSLSGYTSTRSVPMAACTSSMSSRTLSSNACPTEASP